MAFPSFVLHTTADVAEELAEQAARDRRAATREARAARRARPSLLEDPVVIAAAAPIAPASVEPAKRKRKARR